MAAAVRPANQVENPDPQPKTCNYYTQSGNSGGFYSAFADTKQHSVAPVICHLDALSKPVDSNCYPTHYLLNNYNAGYFVDRTVDTTDTFCQSPKPRNGNDNVLAAAHGRYLIRRKYKDYVQAHSSPHFAIATADAKTPSEIPLFCIVRQTIMRRF
ncbi:MAG: hypothetical protein ACJ8AI_21455, partial [Rhodopila sp.]